MNIIVPFTLNEHEVKGRLIKLNDVLNIILKQHEYTETVSKIVGELLMIASLMGSQFKNEVTLTIQLQEKDKNQYVIVDYQSPGYIRGYANSNNSFQNALLTVTIDQPNAQRYQGVIEVGDLSISEALERYFDQSEQIGTTIKLKIGKVILPENQESWCGGGIIIQKLPLKVNEVSWTEANLYLNTIRDDELLDPSLSIEALLYSLYNEMKVTVYEPIVIEHKCRCSRNRVEEILLSLGYEEVKASLINENISVDCQFCNQSQIFSEKEIEEMFNKEQKIYEKT